MTDDKRGALTAGRLLIASLIVGPLSSCGGSLVVAGGVAFMAVRQPGDEFSTSSDFAVFVFGFYLVMATIVSLLFVIFALLLIALPLTLLLSRLGAGVVARDAALLGVGIVAAVLLWPASVSMHEGEGWVLPAYALVSAMAWVMALHHIERRNRFSQAGAHV